MEALYGYYAAADDQDASRAVWLTSGETSGDGFDQILVQNIDPNVDLLPVEFAVTGRPASVIKSDPRHGRVVAALEDGEVVCVSLTDAFRDAFAGIGQDFLHDVARGWARSARFTTPPDIEQLDRFLQQLAALAERAVARGHGLYCWIRR
ncbi:hypothetical protein ACFV3E_31365 [Streptomyces sp. NPDC059718]